VFTDWYRAMRSTVHGAPIGEVEAAYRAADARLEGAGMPGVRQGLLPLALLCLRLERGLELRFADDTDWGPYGPWVRPVLLAEAGREAEAAAALRRAPEPPGDLMMEAMWALMGRAAIALGDKAMQAKVEAALRPAAGELAGAGSGMLSLGPVAGLLNALNAAG
jgi:hypothetical protein